MLYLSAFIILFSTCIHVNGLSLTPCKLQDLNCFKRMMKDFMDQTSNGIPEYNMISINPLIIQSLDIDLHNEAQTMLHFKNLEVNGLKDQELINFDVDVDKKKAMFVTQEDPEISGDLTVVFRKTSKTFTGNIGFKGKTMVNSTSDYHFETDSEGIDRIIYGPESMICEVLGELKVTLSPEIQASVEEDEQLYEDNVSGVFCKIVEESWSTVMQNIRELSKIVPKSEILLGV